MILNPLKAWREREKLTQIEAAKVLGLQQCEVSYYERFVTLPKPARVAQLDRIVPALGTDLAAAFYRHQIERTPPRRTGANHDQA